MSIIRVGLSETKKFAEGYDAIFSKKKGSQARKKAAGAKGGRGELSDQAAAKIYKPGWARPKIKPPVTKRSQPRSRKKK